MSDTPLTPAQQHMPTLQARLEEMSDKELTIFYHSSLEAFLSSGEELQYDPDQDIMNIDNPEDELPSVNEMLCLEVLDMCEIEMGKRTAEKASMY